MGEIMEVEEVEEVMMEVEKSVKVELEEETQVVVEEIPQAKEDTQRRCLKMFRANHLDSPPTRQAQQHHWSSMASHPFGVQKHLPFQAHRQLPLICNGADH